MSLQLSLSFSSRLFRSTVALPLVALLAGCFSLQPVDRLAPSVGAEVAVDLNDAGRSALAPTLGSEVAQVHGHLIRRDGDQDVLAVTSTAFVHGGERTWAGETVHVRTDYASRYYENRVSTKRSLIVGGLIAGALAVLTVEALQPTRNPGPGGDVIEPPGDKQRVRPRGAIHFSTNLLDARRRAQFLIPFLTRR
jgi:hypothetical protein